MNLSRSRATITITPMCLLSTTSLARKKLTRMKWRESTSISRRPVAIDFDWRSLQYSEQIKMSLLVLKLSSKMLLNSGISKIKWNPQRLSLPSKSSTRMTMAQLIYRSSSNSWLNWNMNWTNWNFRSKCLIWTWMVMVSLILTSSADGISREWSHSTTQPRACWFSEIRLQLCSTCLPKKKSKNWFRKTWEWQNTISKFSSTSRPVITLLIVRLIA